MGDANMVLCLAVLCLVTVIKVWCGVCLAVGD